MFNSEQVDFMRSIGLDLDFKNLTDDDLIEVEDAVSKKFQTSGLDDKNGVTEAGKKCESILDLLS